jgi:hypothetical protein
VGRLLTEPSQVIEADLGEGEHQRLAHLWKSRRGQVCFDLSCMLIAGSHISASGQCKNTYTTIKFEPACFHASSIAMESLNMCNRSYEVVSYPGFTLRYTQGKYRASIVKENSHLVTPS